MRPGRQLIWASTLLTTTGLLFVSCQAPASVPTPLTSPPPVPSASPPTPTPAAPTMPAPPTLPAPQPTPTLAVPAATSPVSAAGVDPQAGEKTFYAVGCIGCHTVQGVGGRVGPDLTDIARRRDAAYIRESEVDPKAYVVPGYPPVMPSARELGLNDQDVENIIAWFQSLK